MNVIFNIILTILSPLILLAYAVWEILQIMWNKDVVLDYPLSSLDEEETIENFEPPIMK